MTEVVVRRLKKLTPDMLAKLGEYGRESLGEAALDEWMLPVVAAWGFMFICEVGDEFVGSAQGFRCSDGGDIYLDCFYIRPQYRRQSLGASLLGVVMDRMGQQGCRRLLVTAARENEAAMGLYETAGFEEVEEMADFYGDGRHRLLMAVVIKGDGSH